MFLVVHQLTSYPPFSLLCHNVPCRADNLYDFFLQWTPDIYGKDIDASDVGFVVVDQEDTSLEVVEDFFDEPITKDWEVCI